MRYTNNTLLQLEISYVAMLVANGNLLRTVQYFRERFIIDDHQSAVAVKL